MKPFQFRLIDLLGIMLWTGVVLAAWRTGLLQPQLMPVLFPAIAALAVYGLVLAVKRYRRQA